MNIDYSTNTVYTSYDEFVSFITSLDPKSRSKHTYIDESTNDVLWQEGQPVSKARLKKQKKLSTPKVTKPKKTSIDKSYDEFDLAVKEFVSSLDMEDLAATYSDGEGFAIEDFASDLADGFFWTYPWEQWSKDLGMSKSDMKLYVAEMIAG
jgi:hypothetical protein